MSKSKRNMPDHAWHEDMNELKIRKQKKKNIFNDSSDYEDGPDNHLHDDIKELIGCMDKLGEY